MPESREKKSGGKEVNCDREDKFVSILEHTTEVIEETETASDMKTGSVSNSMKLNELNSNFIAVNLSLTLSFRLGLYESDSGAK